MSSDTMSARTKLSRGLSQGWRETMAQRRSLTSQMLAAFLVLALVPLLSMTLFVVIVASERLVQIEKRSLGAITQRQVDDIGGFYRSRSSLVSILAEGPTVTLTLQEYVAVTPGEARHLSGSPGYLETRRTIAPILRKLAEQVNLQRVMLVNPQDLVILESSQAPLENWPMPYRLDAESALAELIGEVGESGRQQSSEFQANPLNGERALYFAAPVFLEGRFLGSLVIVPDNEDLLAKINNTRGMPISAEILLATREQDQIVVLNEPRNAPEDFTGTFPAEPAEDEDLTAMQRALERPGASGSGEMTDYRGKEVLALWRPLDMLDAALVVKVDRSEILQPVRQLMLVAAAGAGVTTIVVVFVAIFMVRGITGPIIQLTETANRLADGDLTTRVEVVGRSEIGMLSRAHQAMSNNLRSLVTKVKVTTDELSRSAAKLGGSAKNQVSAAEKTKSSAAQASEVSQNIDATASSLSETVKEVNRVAQETAAEAEGGLDALQILDETMNQLANGNDAVAQQLQIIQDKADGIADLIIVMTKVADQTNLLSLNAAIEARKAGEAGRGFRVVADEIRQLADQAAEGTLKIEASVNEMGQAVSSGVKEMRSFSQRVERSTREILAVSQRLSGVIQQVQGLPPRFDQVLDGMQSQTNGAAQIHESMDHLNDSAQATASAIRETQQLIKSLEQSAQLLQQEISRFRT